MKPWKERMTVLLPEAGKWTWSWQNNKRTGTGVHGGAPKPPLPLCFPVPGIYKFKAPSANTIAQFSYTPLRRACKEPHHRFRAFTSLWLRGKALLVFVNKDTRHDESFRPGQTSYQQGCILIKDTSFGACWNLTLLLTSQRWGNKGLAQLQLERTQKQSTERCQGTRFRLPVEKKRQN